MNIRTTLNYLSQILFFGAAAAILLAFAELLAGAASFSLIGDTYPPGRLIELSAALLVFVIAVTLREIRDELRALRS